MSYFPANYSPTVDLRKSAPASLVPSFSSLSVNPMASPAVPRRASEAAISTPSSSSALHFALPAASRSTTSLIPSPSGSTATRARTVSMTSGSVTASVIASMKETTPPFNRSALLSSPLPPVPPPKGPVPPIPTQAARTPTESRARGQPYDTFEGCMEGGIKYETQSAALGHTGDVAELHLNRAAGLFAAALSFQPNSTWARLRRATVLLHLSASATPVTAVMYLRDAETLLAGLTSANPNSSSTRETLATVCSRLSRYLHILDDQADDVAEVWEGEVGRFACEALEALEEVATERMDRVRSLRRDAFEGEAPALADMFLALAEAAGTVATLATDLDTVDGHAELAEHALDQAANMATLAAAAKVRPTSSGAALITRVQLASGRAAAERMRHMFLLGVPLDEDDFNCLISDMTLLVKETRDRASRLKGSKGAAAAAQAFEAVQQLGDTKVLYANLLRCVWRARRELSLSPTEPVSPFASLYSAPTTPTTPTTPGLVRDHDRRGSRTASMSSVMSVVSEQIETPPMPEESIPEETEEEAAVAAAEEAAAKRPTVTLNDPPKRTRAPPPPPLKLSRPPTIPLPPLPQLSPHAPRTPLSPLNPSSTPALLRRASDFTGTRPRLGQSASFHALTGSPAWRTAVSTPSISAIPPLPSPAIPLNDNNPGLSPAPSHRRRLSSMTRPLNAWDRKPSFCFSPSPAVSPGAADGHVPTSELAYKAYTLLSGALKHYKVALTLLSQAEVGSKRARLKSEVLAGIANISLFRAMLAPRMKLAGLLEDKDDPKQLLNTAEVYSTWAAREVGWSFIIEGTPSAELADRRSGQWEDAEAGKRAVLLTLRIWWYRATSDVGADKTTAKENVARVVKRLRDLEGVAHGDVARFTAAVSRLEGDLDPVEHLFWRSVKRILRGGEGEIM